MLFSSKLRTATCSTTECALAWYRLAGSVSTCSAHQPARHSLDPDSHATNAMGVLVSPKRATQNDGGRGGLPYQRPSVRARKCPHSHLGRLLAVHPPREHILAQLHRLEETDRAHRALFSARSRRVAAWWRHQRLPRGRKRPIDGQPAKEIEEEPATWAVGGGMRPDQIRSDQIRSDQIRSR